MRFGPWTILPLAFCAAPLAAQEQLACWSYADHALFVVAEAQKFNCGLTGPRWSADYNTHYNFCMAQGQNGGSVMAFEMNQRNRDLATCWGEASGTQAYLFRTDVENQSFPLTQPTFCRNYADVAIQQVRVNLEYRCGHGDDGARWSQNWENHLNGCLGGFGARMSGESQRAKPGRGPGRSRNALSGWPPRKRRFNRRNRRRPRQPVRPM